MLSQQRKVLLGIRGRFPCHYCLGVSTTTTTTTTKHNVNVVPYIQQQLYDYSSTRNTLVSPAMENFVYSLRRIQLTHSATTRSMSTPDSSNKLVDTSNSDESDISNKPVQRLRMNQKSCSDNDNNDTPHTNTDSISNIATSTTKKDERSKNHRRKKQKRESLSSGSHSIDRITESNCMNHDDHESSSIVHNHNSLMIQCTKPSVIASLHPAVRSALLHDEIKHEFHNVHNSNIDTNIWH